MLYYNCVKTGRMSTKKAAQLMGRSEEMFIKVYTHLDDDKEDTDDFFREDELICYFFVEIFKNSLVTQGCFNFAQKQM